MTKHLYISLIALILCFYTCKQNTSLGQIRNTKNVSLKLKSVLINGYRIHYTDFGTGEPVVFVHGSLGDYRSWAAQVDTFATKYRVIAYSRRYAYPNEQVLNDSADYSVIPHVKDLTELIKKLDLGKVHLVGHSLGAFTVLKTAIDHPELIKTITLGEPPILSLLKYTKGGDTLIANLMNKAFAPSAKAFKEGDNEKGISHFIGGVMGDSLTYYKVPEFVRKRWLQNTIGLRGHVINRSFIDIPREDVQSVKTPVLVMKGEHSPTFLRVIADTLNALLPNSKLFELPESSHGLQSSNPGVFNKTVLNFIDSN